MANFFTQSAVVIVVTNMRCVSDLPDPPTRHTYLTHCDYQSNKHKGGRGRGEKLVYYCGEIGVCTPSPREGGVIPTGLCTGWGKLWVGKSIPHPVLWPVGLHQGSKGARLWRTHLGAKETPKMLMRYSQGTPNRYPWNPSGVQGILLGDPLSATF